MNDLNARAENGDREAAPQETHADTTTAGAGSSGEFRATWVRKADGSRIGKVQKASGKWPPTPGAASKRFLIEVKEYPGGLDEFRVDYEARMKAGSFALVAGEPRLGLNLGKPHNRAGENLIDAASTRFVLDFDGLEPDDAAAPIDGAGAYTESAIFVALARLPKAFEPAKCMVSTTSSTGLKTVSTGAPSEGKARLRGTWELSRPLTCGQKKTLAKALKTLPGLGCIDSNLYSPEHFEFVARPVFLPGRTDPIAEPVYTLGGGLLDVEAICAELGLDLDLDHGVESSNDPSRSGAPPPGPGRPLTAKSGLALDLPPEQAEPLLRALLTAIGNGDGLRDDYNEWFGVVAAIFNASKGADWGLELAVEWTGIGYDTAEVYDKWKNLREAGDAKNGVDNLVRLAMALAKEKKAEAGDAARAKAAELEAAVSGIDRARAATAGFPDDIETLGLPEEDDEPDEMDEALLASRMPAIAPKAFYGPLKEIVEAATKHSEATKIGVALQTIAHAALCLRPFCIPLGDGPICLNVFLLQIGLSSVGRKGTSSAFADRFAGPTIQALAKEVRLACNNVEYDRATKEDAREAVRQAERNVEHMRLLGDADAVKAAALIATLKTEKTEAETTAANWKKKLAAKAFTPATQKKYEQSIRQMEARIAALGPRIFDAEAEHARIMTVLADRAAAIAVAEAALARAKADEAAIPEPQATPEPGDELFMELASPPRSMTGVSSGEGVISEIRDARPPNGTRDDKGDLGVKEKRLLINLSEFGVVLAQIRRTGSTLSTTLRDAYDCVPLMTGSKNSPSRVEKPYICISASITPAEFTRLTFDDREATSADNGLAGRFLTVYAAREKLVACPLPTEGREQVARGIAENILKVYRDLKPTEPFRHAPIEFTPEARAIYDEGGVYERIANLSGASGKAGKLLTRIATNLRKIAAILAIMNGESRVSVGALEAAVAWVEYSEASADVIASTIADRRRHAKLKEDTASILAALKTLGGVAVPSREVRRAIHFDEKRFQAAIAFIINRPPSPVEIVEQDWIAGNGTVRKRSLLRLTQSPEKAAQAKQQKPEEPFPQSPERADMPPSVSSFPSEGEKI